MNRTLLFLAFLLTTVCTESCEEAQDSTPGADEQKAGQSKPESVPAPPKPAQESDQPKATETVTPPTQGKIDTLAFSDQSNGLPTSGPFAGVAMADLDGDGKAEIVSGRREDERGLFLFSFKDGRWSSRQITPRGEYGGLALADITGDGVPDVLAAKTAGRTRGLELFETKREGAALSFEAIPSPYTDGCDDLDVGDIDDDGDLDIVVSSRGDRVLLNAGDGRSFEKIELDSDVYEDTGIVLADVNGDKHPDVLSTNHPGKNTRLFLCESIKPVRFSPRHTTGLPLDNKIGFKIAAADVNGDGHVDLAIGTQAGLRLFHGNSCQGAEAGWWKETPLSGRGSQTIQPVLADLDRDGHADLTYTSDQGIHIRLNDGEGGFGERLEAAAIPAKGDYSGCCIADWDQDGDLDIAFSSFQGNGLRLLINSP